MLSNCIKCEKDVGMGLCLNVDICFHASSLPGLHTFWHAICIHLFTFLLFPCIHIKYMMIHVVRVCYVSHHIGWGPKKQSAILQKLASIRALASVSVASIDVASVRVYKNPASIQAD